MAEQETVWAIEEHTLAKHQILFGYLQAWIPIMASWNGRLVIVDGFAGPGVYKGGEPGSPILALKAFLEHDAREQIGAELVYMFIEEDKARFDRLQSEIAKLGTLPDQVKLHLINDAYENAFAAVLDQVDGQGRQLAPTFAFVDPFGYSQASMKLAGRFLQFGGCEVLAYVPFRFVNRFVGRDGQEPALNSLFGTDRWKEALDLKGSERLQKLHDLFRDQLASAGGLKYVQSFEIITSKPNTGYHLFCGTTHIRGLQKMKEMMWKVDPLAGARLRASTTREQQPLFQADVDARPLEEGLRSKFGDRVFSFEEAELYTWTETPYLPTHLRKLVLKPLEQSDRLEIVKAKPKRRRYTYPEGTRMRIT